MPSNITSTFKRWLLAILVALILLAALSGCGVVMGNMQIVNPVVATQSVE